MTAAEEPARPRFLGLLGLAVLVCGGCCLLEGLGLGIATVVIHLAFGWLAFVVERVPKLEPNFSAIGLAAVCLSGVVALGHHTASWLRASQGGTWQFRWTLALAGLLVIAFAGGTAAVGIVHQTTWLATGPPILEARGRADRNAYAAQMSLMTLESSQQLFREGDKDGDGRHRFGTLAQLSETQLIDTILGAGTKQGFHFAAHPSVTTPEVLWFATASPAIPGVTGHEWFFMNQTGDIFATTSGAFPVDRATCGVPTGLVLVRPRRGAR